MSVVGDDEKAEIRKDQLLLKAAATRSRSRKNIQKVLFV